MAIVYNQKAMYDFVHGGDRSCHSCDVQNEYYSCHPDKIIANSYILEFGLISALVVVPLVSLIIYSIIKWLNRVMS